jgi:hypothetical protein
MHVGFASLVYCAYLMSQNSTWGDLFFSGSPTPTDEDDEDDTEPHSFGHNLFSVGVCTLMAVMWFGGFALYGIGMYYSVYACPPSPPLPLGSFC